MSTQELIKRAGGVNKLAGSLGISPAAVSQWAHGARRVPAERCLEIERLTNGQVRCEELRPDMDWSVLRGSQPTAA